MWVVRKGENAKWQELSWNVLNGHEEKGAIELLVSWAPRYKGMCIQT